MAANTALVLMPESGQKDPAEMMREGKLTVNWTKVDGSVAKVTKFNEQKMPQLREGDLALPDLYLHTLDERFRVKDGEYSLSMRAGNDNSELMLVLPENIVNQPREMDADLKAAFDNVLRFLRSQGEVMVSQVKSEGAKWEVNMNSHRLNFKMKTSRPKAGISLPKHLFGIPAEADLYLFVENHISVNFMSEKDREDLEKCVADFGESSDKDLLAIQVFLKIFYEGGFAYNKKKQLAGGYLPVNLSITCLGVTPAFEGQVGIATGYPYRMAANFLPFVDTVPVTIRAIAEMSEHHKRYGLCFTRAVQIWEGPDFNSSGALEFSSIMTHGGFYYVPETLQKHAEIGGLVYAFGESKEASGEAVNETAVNET